MDGSEELMSKRKWIKHCLTAIVAQPEDIVIYGTVSIGKVQSNVLSKMENKPELYDAIQALAPECWVMIPRSP